MKYLTDGRKVSVIEKLNNTDFIVQEIYVTEDGSEVPAGEKFVVKTLLDKPVISWKKRKIQEIEKSFDEIKARHEKALANVQRQEQLAAEKIRQLKAIATKVTSEQLKTLEKFVSGKIKYLVVHEYDTARVVESDKFLESWDGQYFEGFKLISLFGRSDGNLSYKVNRYRDDSGFWTTVDPCETMEQAVLICQKVYDEKVQEWLDGKKQYPPSDNFAIGCEIKLDERAVDFYKNVEDDKIKKEIKNLKKRLEELEALGLP